MSMTSSGTDVIQLLEADHRQAEQLLVRFDTTPASERDSYFCELVNELVRHEVAEEIVVYPAIRKDAPGGDAEADARIAEQSEAEKLLKEMESMDANSAQFETSFGHLRDAVLSHAQAEENGAFRLLQQSENPEARATLGQRYETAKRAAPTHPHPHAPDSPPGNTVLGPIAAVFDKVRDAVAKR
jgi:hemerythrin superfamily protein